MLAPGCPSPPKRTERVEQARFFAGLVGLALASAAVWLVVWATAAPFLLGWTPVAVTSGSMAPLIDNGDLVVAAPYDGEDLGSGTVITFDDAMGRRVTHRIVARTPDGDYVTRGDANGRNDSTPVPPDRIVGVGRLLVPAAGQPAVWIDNGQWAALAIATIAMAAALWVSRWALLPRFNPWRTRSVVPATPRRRRMIVDVSTPIVVLTVVGLSAVVVTAARTDATFVVSTANAANSLNADTLEPPTALAVTPSGSDIDLTWTGTADLYADGYNIYRGTTPGGPYGFLDSVSGQGTTAYTDVGANSNATPTFESVATAIQGPNSGNGVTVAVPAGTTDGDLLVAVIGIDNSSNTLPIGAPGAFTELFQHGQTGGGQSALAVWYRIASSEPANYSFTWASAEEGFGAILRYSGVDAATPIDVWGLNGVTNDASPTAPDLTTTVADALVLRVLGVDGNSHTEPSPLNSIHPAGTTGRFELITDPAPASSGGTFGALAEEAQATAGPTGTAAFNISGSDGWIAATIALTPSGGSPTYYYVTEAYDTMWTSVYSNEATI